MGGQERRSLDDVSQTLTPWRCTLTNMGLHPASCRDPECQLPYVEHLRGIGISAEATPNRKPHAAQSVAKDRVWDKDLDAYKRLRTDGVQPSSNLGSARLEATADHRWQIEAKPRQECEA